MEKTIKIFKSFEEADKAEIVYWQNATLEERINSLLFTQEMMRQFFYREAKGIEKVVTKRNLYDDE